MAGFKETPRQKMISMMYLVLTALLALNVSVDILDAFATVNDGLESSNSSVQRKIEDYYSTFQQQYNQQGAKVAEYWAKAQDIRVKTDEIINYIEKEIKLPLVLRTDNITEEEFLNPKDESKALLRNKEKINPKNRRVFYEFNLKNVDAKDKYDEPTNFMINEGKAAELREKIDAYRQYIINTVTSAGIMNYGTKVGLLTSTDANGNPIHYYNANNEELDWENKNFYHVIMAADIAILNKIIGEIQTTEFDAVSELFKRIGATDYKFNALEARVLPKSTYVLTGQNYEADVFIAASDTTRKFDIKYAIGVDNFNKANEKSVRKGSSESGIVRLTFPGTAVGIQNYAGVVEMNNPETNEKEYYPFQGSYTVAPPSATIAPTQMMIFYQGVPNEISVSSPGVSNDKIEVTISKGKITPKDKAKGEYLVEVPAGEKTATVTAYGTMDGKRVELASYQFRVKRIPSPEAKIGGISSGKIDKNTLLAAGAIIPDMGDFEFGNFNYIITQYQLSTIVGGDYKTSGTIRNGGFSGEARSIIEKAKRGQKLFFENIQAKGPDGVIRTLNPINIEIK